VRFLALELDGRTTLDRTRQGLYGVVMGQATAASQRPSGSELKRQAGNGTHRVARKPRVSRRGLAVNIRYGWPSLRPA
jgi:hypothetical protein